MFNIVLFGGPGSGKGTQSAYLVHLYSLYHISTGEVLREQIRLGTELGKIADSYISKGNLIPDDLMVQILADVLDKQPDTKKGVIFDGFPRTLPQAKALKKVLEERGTKLDAVIGLEVPDDVLIGRLINRGKETGRADDNPETIKKRLVVYHNQTTPLREYYVNEGIYLAIDGNGKVEEVMERIVHSLDPIRKPDNSTAAWRLK